MKYKPLFIIFFPLVAFISCTQPHDEPDSFITLKKSFSYSDHQYTVILNGVKNSNANFAFNKILEKFSTEKSFSIEHPDFVDAEKIDADDMSLCWAGSCSNSLYVSGWNTADFADEDALYDYYRKYFNDEGSFFQSGISWFFNGIVQQSQADKLLKENEILESHAHYPELACQNIVTVIPFVELKSDPDRFNSIKDILPSSCAEISVDEHSVTLQGIIYDETENHVASVIISNSDNDIISDPNEKAPDKYDVYPVKKTLIEEEDIPSFTAWVFLDYLDQYGPRYIRNIRYITKKNFTDIQKVKEIKGTKKICETPELEFQILRPGDQYYGRDEEELQKNLKYSFFIHNDSYIEIQSQNIYVTINFYKNGAFVKSYEESIPYDTNGMLPPCYVYSEISIAKYKNDFEPGEYEFEIIGNNSKDENKIVKEAYYSNNSTARIKFKFQ